MASVSAIVLTKNEENTIIDCLESLRWCDEILVVDDDSNDRTVELVKRTNAKVYQHALNNDFAQQRNYALEKAKGDYVLFVDADERIPLSLQYEVLSILNNPLNKYRAISMQRKDYMWGKELKHGETGGIRLIRLARKGSGRWEGKVHEVWQIKGETYECKNALLHFPHQTIREFLQEINYYTNLRAQELYKEKKKSHWWSVLLYPKAKFFINFVMKRGFLDGIEGLVFAILMSFHSFLVRGKLWLLWQEKTKK